MSILLDKDTRVLVQGITGKAGSFHAAQMRSYGTQVVAGVTPGRGGTRWEGVPIFDTVWEAARETGATATAIFVPAPFGADAILEAAEAGLSLGIITPGAAKVGVMPGYIHKPGPVGVVSRSGTLTYEAVWQLTRLNLGQSTCLGIGGDSIPGTGFVEILERFQEDPQTKGVVLIGEIGGVAEEEAAAFIRKRFTKPAVAFVAGATAPAEKRMGHAGAVIAQGQGTHASKIRALKEAGVSVADNPAMIGQTLARALQELRV
ncbi:MAG: succinate--CoA ligase subunit alpha [Candidatus Omnitrophica bacterium]|nr:succinate--CoA ligase subunit alpha [Candidatus Omnitrophota bacterium]